jgi:nucleotide-binding universal stress UspA family protein
LRLVKTDISSEENDDSIRPIMKLILAAVDNSKYADGVMSRAVELAGLELADLVLLSVIDSDPMINTSIAKETDQLTTFQRGLIFKHFPRKDIAVESEASTGAVYRHTAQEGMKIQTKILQGNPVDKICSCADEVNADLVVIGNRGLGNIGTAVLGSVSEKVVRKCLKSVLVVKSTGSSASKSSDWESVHSRRTVGLR